LKNGGRGAIGGGYAQRLSRLLMSAEVALAVVLLAGAGVMTRSFLNLYTADLGVNTADTLTMLLRLPGGAYPRPGTQIAFFERLAARLKAVPGIESAAIASTIPSGGAARFPYELADTAPVAEQSRPTTSTVTVGPDYFRTLGAAVLSGREFNDFDGPSSPPAVVVNQRFADQHWPEDTALDKRLRLFDGPNPGAWRTVVGVVPNIVQNDWPQIDPVVYVPYRQAPRPDMWVFLRTPLSVADLGGTLRREINALDPSLPIAYGPDTLADRLVLGPYANGSSYAKVRNHATLFLVVAAIALGLASLGLYAVVAHSVRERTPEIGIRMAIGGSGADILALVLREGLRPLGIGLGIGLAASLVVNRLLQAELVQVSPSDPLSLTVASIALIAAALLGCLIPTRRAMRVDPVVALRQE
jgi:predicted permease